MFTLDPSFVFLNHGSFGACPVPVQQKQAALRAQMEAQPVRFFVRELPDLLDAARLHTARFVGADPADLVFVPNATTGVNVALGALRLQAGDQILITSQGYNACNNAARHVATEAGASVLTAQLPWPVPSEDALVEAILGAVGPRTRVAIVDHVTSPTAIVLPVERLVAALEERGVVTIVDGAHAPGMLPLALNTLGASFYTGNLHKWVCAPKGAAFLVARRDWHQRVRPMVISHGANSPRTDRPRHWLEFDWVGTGEYTPYLCVPAAIETMAAMHPDGWPGVMAANRALALEARDLLCDRLGVAPPVPDGMIGSMAAVELPDQTAPPQSLLDILPLQDALFERGIEVPVVGFPQWPRQLVRVSAQRYNHRAQYAQLADALVELTAR